MEEKLNALIPTKENMESFNDKIDRMYLEYIEKFMKGYSEERKKIAKLMKQPEEEAEKDILVKEKEFKDITKKEEKIRNLTNNFFTKFPGGWYRDLEDVKDKKKMFDDMDEIIKEEGYSEEDLKLISNQTLEGKANERRWEIIITVFLAMKEKGYDTSDLWR